MRTWDYFYSDVLPEALGCPEPTVDRHLQRAAEKLCAEARIWREDLDPIITKADLTEFDVDAPSAAVAVDRIVAATLDGEDIDVEGPDATSAGDRQRGNTGRSRITLRDMSTVQVLPTPGADRSLVLTAILKPSPTAAGFDNDALADQYRMAIAAGALSTLLAMGGKVPWRDPAQAGIKAAEFKDAIGTARARAFRGNTNARARMRTNFF